VLLSRLDCEFGYNMTVPPK